MNRIEKTMVKRMINKVRGKLEVFRKDRWFEPAEILFYRAQMIQYLQGKTSTFADSLRFQFSPNRDPTDNID